MLFNRWIARVSRRNEFMANQKTANDVMEGEDAIVAAMQRFSNDAACVDDLKGFKTATEEKIAEYKQAVVMKMKEELTERAQKQLQTVASFEAGMGAALQQLVVKEAASSFKTVFPNDSGMQTAAFDSALAALRGDSVSASANPVSKHFNDAFAGLASGTGALAERVEAAQKEKEGEFQQQFMVTKAEVEAVAGLTQRAGGADFDPSKLSADDLKELEGLYRSINNKVGFAVPDVKLEAIPTTDAGSGGYVASVNSQLAAATSSLQAARLKAFTQSFA